MSRARRIILTFIFLVTALSLSVCTSQPKPVKTGPSGWTTTDNQRGRLADYKGKVVVLDFYATWCQPCRAETPKLVALQNRYGAQGLQIIGLNVGGEDDQSEVPAYAKEFKIGYPLALPDDELVDMYMTDNQNIPQSFVFDRNGEIVRRFVGYSDDSGAELERIVQSVLPSASQNTSQQP